MAGMLARPYSTCSESFHTTGPSAFYVVIVSLYLWARPYTTSLVSSRHHGPVRCLRSWRYPQDGARPYCTYLSNMGPSISYDPSHCWEHWPDPILRGGSEGWGCWPVRSVSVRRHTLRRGPVHFLRSERPTPSKGLSVQYRLGQMLGASARLYSTNPQPLSINRPVHSVRGQYQSQSKGPAVFNEFSFTFIVRALRNATSSLSLSLPGPIHTLRDNLSLYLDGPVHMQQILYRSQ